MKYCFAALMLLAGLLIAEEPKSAELAAEEVITKPFETPEKWEAADSDAWEWREEDGVKVLRLLKQSDYQPAVRSPFNLIWFQGTKWESFDLRVEMRLTTFNKKNNDLCIAFAGKDATHFFYSHLGQKADVPHHQIHIVNEADRKPVTRWRTQGTPWKEEAWHEVRMVRDAATGETTVFFDGDKMMTAKDQTFSKGMIGLGSFDDTGDFRNLEVRGIPIQR